MRSVNLTPQIFPFILMSFIEA